MSIILNICNLLKNDDEVDEEQLKRSIKSLDSSVLSYLHYFSLFSFKNNMGRFLIASKILYYLNKFYYEPFNGTITLTFGDVAESHVGMQKIGTMADTGFSYSDLLIAQKYFKRLGCETGIIHLNDFLPEPEAYDDNPKEVGSLQKANENIEYQAYVLVAKDGLKHLTGDNGVSELTLEMLLYDWDDKFYNTRRKVVQNKRARQNLNFSKTTQISDFKEGKGTTISWNDVPLLFNLKGKIVDAFGDAARDLKCEGNKYCELDTTGIGYHGDSERKKVIGVRLGSEMTIHWNWFYNNQPRGDNVSLVLNPGDIYCMSEKAVGTDWKYGSKYTLRHAAGSKIYTTKTPKLTVEDIEKRSYEGFPGPINVGKAEIKIKKRK